jgi:hypothetical protein
LNIKTSQLLFNLAASAALTLSIAAQAEPDAATHQDKIQQLIEQLQLTDEQLAEIRPVLESHAEQTMTILDKYDIERPQADGERKSLGLRDARKLKGEMQTLRSETRAQLEGVLSEEQLAEYDKLAQERRAELRERIKSRR